MNGQVNPRTMAQRAALKALAKLDRLASAVANARTHTLTAELKLQDGAPADTVGTPSPSDLMAYATTAAMALAELDGWVDAASESE